MQKLLAGCKEQRRWDAQGHWERIRLWGESHRLYPNDPCPNTLMGWMHQQKVMIGLADDPPQSVAETATFAGRAFAPNDDEPIIDLLYLLATLDKMDLKQALRITNVSKANPGKVACSLIPSSGSQVLCLAVY
ncbi:MAG: hypothetical protein AB3N20_05355 [Rhizobiaceae bacterium]